MNIHIVLPFKDAQTQYRVWATEEANIDFRKEPERAARCTVCFAATELEHYLDKIGFSVTVSSQHRDAYNIVLVLPKKLPANTSNYGSGVDFSIRYQAEGMVIEGSGRIGVLYGAYELLKAQGICWLNPWEEVLPPKRDTLILPEEKQYRPSFPMGRGFEFEGTLKESELLYLWMARNKLNLSGYRPNTAPLQRKLGMIFKNGGHIFEAILNPDSPLPSGKTIWEEHPEWYGLPESGVRKKSEAVFTQFCMSNEGLLEYLADKLLQKAQKEWYHADRIDVFGFDTWGSTCCCPKCKELGNGADQNVHFMSYLREYFDRAYAEGKLDRRVNLVFGAYEGTASLKAPVHKVPDNVRTSGDYFIFSPILRCFEHSFGNEDCDHNRYYNAHLKEWSDIPICINDYYNVSKFEDLPYLFTGTMVRDLRHYHSLGVKGMTYMHLPMLHWGVRNLTQMLYAELCWDVNVDTEEVIAKYFANRYGTHGARMKQAYGYIEEAGLNCSSWRAWCQKSILSNLQNWDGGKPTEPLFRDSHLGENAVSLGKRAVKSYEAAIKILEEEIRKADDEYIRNTSFVSGIALNPTDARFKSTPNVYGERLREDLRYVKYGKDCMELLALFVEYYELLENSLDSDTVFHKIEALAEKMSMYYIPIQYFDHKPEILCLDALSRSQLKGLYYRCKAKR